MKKMIKAALAVVMMMVAVNGYAQQKKMTPEQKAKNKTEMMAKELSLTDTQKTTVYKLMLEREQFTAGLAGKTPEEKKTAWKEGPKTDAELKKILTPEQYKTYKENKAAADAKKAQQQGKKK